MKMTTEPESSPNAVLATATLVGTVGLSQKQQQDQQRQQIVSFSPVTNNLEINEDGKGLGVAMSYYKSLGSSCPWEYIHRWAHSALLSQLFYHQYFP